MKITLLSFLLFLFTYAGSLKCDIENDVVYCRYFIDRSDNNESREVVFNWIGPDSPVDDRQKDILIPPYHGSAYDFRFLKGRKNGKWKVVVKETESNKSTRTTFVLKGSETLP